MALGTVLYIATDWGEVYLGAMLIIKSYITILTPSVQHAIDLPCECEHNNPDSLDARLFPSVVLAVAPAVAMDEASSLSW